MTSKSQLYKSNAENFIIKMVPKITKQVIFAGRCDNIHIARRKLTGISVTKCTFYQYDTESCKDYVVTKKRNI